jgi:hypothetical protein
LHPEPQLEMRFPFTHLVLCTWVILPRM